MGNAFKESLLDPNVFSITWELVPGRGAREKAQEQAREAAEIAAKDPRIHAVTITDAPGGNPAITAEQLGQEFLALGIEPLVHFTMKDRNRHALESSLYAMERAGVHNLLVMTGDYQSSGFAGRGEPVFDADPAQALDLITHMNKGMQYQVGPKTITNQPTNFFAGCAVSPFKQIEAELITQYYKLSKKIDKGAQFVIPQLGYDMRKFHELIQFMEYNFPGIPVIGNLYLLPYGAGRLMNQNQIPGCVVTDKLLKTLEKEKAAPDKGVGARMERAAKMYGIMKGMGFAGAHIGGHGLSHKQLDQIITEGEEYAKDWERYVFEFDFPMDQGFYYYTKNPKTGLNTKTITDTKNLPAADRIPFNYRFSRFVHYLCMHPGRRLNRPLTWYAKHTDGGGGESFFHAFEHFFKSWVYDCKDCGDCALPNVAYTCPMSYCPKHQRNGPCGGSRDGWCEVYPGKRKCIYVRAYTRLKEAGEELELKDVYVQPCNWELYQTSGWFNMLLGRDHDAERLNVPYYRREKKK